MLCWLLPFRPVFHSKISFVLTMTAVNTDRSCKKCSIVVQIQHLAKVDLHDPDVRILLIPVGAHVIKNQAEGPTLSRLDRVRADRRGVHVRLTRCDEVESQRLSLRL